MRASTDSCRHFAAAISERDEASVGRRGILHLRISALPQYDVPPGKGPTACAASVAAVLPLVRGPAVAGH